MRIQAHGTDIKVLFHSIGATALIGALGAGLLLGQSTTVQRAGVGQSPSPRFAVVSVKPDPPDYRPVPGDEGTVLPGGKYVDHQTALARLIIFAYPQFASPGKTLVGLPSWAWGSLLFDFEAESDPGTKPSFNEMRKMVGAALADRFQFRYHIENRRMPVFFLEVGRAGTRHVKPSAPGEPEMVFNLQNLQPGHIVGRGINMDGIAARVGMYFLAQGLPVINHTGLAGFFDIDAPAAAGPFPGRGGNQTRVREDLTILGLTLRSTTATVPVMVVDHVSKPNPN